MTIGAHDFAIPHALVQPTRDMVIVRIPLPPRKIGSIEIPDVYRDLAMYNVQAGLVAAMGPLAFTYKDADGLQRQDVNVGDWVTFRPYAGTMVQGGKLMVNCGWRYMSSFQDVIGIIPGDKMPAAATLRWDEDEDPAPAPPPHAGAFAFDNRK